MHVHQAQREKRWKVVKNVDNEYSDIEWKDVVVVVVETRWEESHMKVKPSQENQLTRARSGHRRRKDETRQR
jgi:hypothetical protein